MSDLGASSPSTRDTKWADGLRGIAAIFVVTSHLSIAYASWLLSPVAEENAKPAFYNLPFLRLFAEGFPWVSIFLVLTGFVNALKPLKQARAGRIDAALSGLASSCFRRTSRLVLPCTIATFFSWIICEFGGFKIGRSVNSSWMMGTSAPPSGSVPAAIHGLLRAIYDTWTWYTNGLDRNQWAMLWFLKGSLTLYMVLLGLVRATPKWRISIFIGLFCYSWACGDTMMGMTVFSGAVLAELSMEPIIMKFSSSQRLVNRLIPFSILFLGLYLMSYPKDNPEWARWSNSLLRIGEVIFPEGADIYSYWNIIGVLLLISGIVLSAGLQRFFCNPVFLWLGTQSFPIYLIHGPLLRSFLNWMLFAFTEPLWYKVVNEEQTTVRIFPRYPIPPAWKFIPTLPVYFLALIQLSRLWTCKIEPTCASVTNWLEHTICGSREQEVPAILDHVVFSRDESSSDLEKQTKRTTNDIVLPR